MKVKYTITGLDCPNCAAKLADMMSAADGVEDAKINFLTEKLTLEISDAEDAVLERVQGIARKFDKSIKIEK